MSFDTSLRQKLLTTRIALAVCASLVVVASSTYFPQTTVGQDVVKGRSESGDMECVSYCSNVRPGVAFIEVRVRVSESQLSEANLRSKVRQQGLEVTVYADGFERNLFANVSAIKPKVFFLAPPKQGRSAARSKIPGLQKLQITDVVTRFDKSAQTLAVQPTGPETAEWVTVRLEGLDPGMAYTFRVPGGKSVVTCHAVVCPVDLIPAPAKRNP
jgi:hypothetical protein